MKLFIKIIINISLFLCIFFILKLFEDRIHLKRNILDRLENSNLSKKITKNLNDVEIFNVKVKSIYIRIISIFMSVFVFFICYKIFNIVSCSLIIAIFSIRIPYLIQNNIIKKRKDNIIRIFPSYVVCLKNYISTKNDITIAMRKVNVSEPLNNYIKAFNNNIQNGISVYDAFESLKNKIGINKLNIFFIASQYSYINGGNFSNILDKYSKMLLEDNIRREKSKQEVFLTKLVIYAMFIINVLVLFIFVFSNNEYKNIITKTFLGKVIINLNIITYILIYLIAKRLEE